MKSIYFRNFLSTALMVLLSFLIVGTALVFMGQGFIISSHRDDMKAIATAVAHMADSAGYEDFTSWDVRISLSVAAKISGNDMLVTNSEGLILSCSDDPGQCRHIGLHVASGEMEKLAASGELNSVTDLGGVYRSPRYVYAMPISEGNPGGGYVFVSSTRSTIMSAWGGFLWVFLAVALAVLSLALVMSLVISKTLSEPLDEMTAAARRFHLSGHRAKNLHAQSMDDLWLELPWWY